MSSASVQKCLSDFQDCVKSLSDSVNGASVDWQDEVYSSLQSSVANVASASKAVLTAGSLACSSLGRVESILQEG